MRTPVSVAPRYPERSPVHLQRACFAALQAATQGAPGDRDPAQWARRLYGDSDPAVNILTRAAIGGATTTTSGWASELVTTAVADYLTGLAPLSAAAELMARSVVVPLADDWNVVNVPYAPTVPSGGYIAEGLPLPAATAPLSTAVLTPAKAGFGVMLSREVAQVGGEVVLRQLLAESAALTLDSLVFNTTAPGLLAGVTPLTSTGSPLGDLASLAKAVSAGGPCLFIAGTEAAAQLAVRNDHQAVVVASAGIPVNRLIACAYRAIIFAALPAPEIEASEEAVWHMADAPLQIASGAQGSATLATPTFSAFQSGNIILRLLITLAFTKRSGSAVAFINVTWPLP